MLEGRVGGYPLMSRDATGVRRKGLMLAGGLRGVFLTGATGVMVMAQVGYETF